MQVRRGLVVISFTLAACGAGRQHQQLGSGRIVVAGAAEVADDGAAGPGAAMPAAAAVVLPPQSANGEYRVRYQIWLPRAMEVQWTLRCGEHEESGEAGETFGEYQVRRVAELEAERERERQKRAQVGSLIGGAVLGAAQAGAGVEAPAGGAHATVTVDGAAAGAAVGAATVTDAPIVLAPDDLGQGYRQGEARFWLGDIGGQCEMVVAPIDPAEDPRAIAGTFAVERWFNAKRAEQRRVATGIVAVRGELQARLVAGGADAGLAARRREEARLAAAARAEAERIAAEARARAEMQAQLELEAHIREEVWQTREAWYVYLGKCGGNRHHREELRAAEERRAQMTIDVRARLRIALVGLGADAELAARLRAQAIEDAARRSAEAQARADAEVAVWRAIGDGAAGARSRMMDSLIAAGARLRPPMPPPVEEIAGVAPATGATWTAGHWTWNGVQWAWIAGRWVGGGGAITVDIGAARGVGEAIGAVDGWDPHGGASGADWNDDGRARDRERAKERDHRRETSTSATPPPAPSGTRERVRDHRDDDDDDDDDDDRGGRPRVRDHR